MSDIRLTEDSKDYLKRIELETLLDGWYLFCMLGISKNELHDEQITAERITTDFTAEFKNNFGSREQLAMLIVMNRMERNGNDLNDKKRLRKTFEDLLSNSGSVISNEGIELMNRYAEAGFKIFKEQYPVLIDKVTFLIQIHKMIEKSLEQ